MGLADGGVFADFAGLSFVGAVNCRPEACSKLNERKIKAAAPENDEQTAEFSGAAVFYAGKIPEFESRHRNTLKNDRSDVISD